jgi:hypothetical protein
MSLINTYFIMLRFCGSETQEWLIWVTLAQGLSYHYNPVLIVTKVNLMLNGI